MIIALRGTKMIIPPQLQFVADRLLESTLRVGTADNDVNAIRNMGMLPEGYTVNHFLTDPDAFFIKTDAPNGFKHFERSPMRTNMEADFDTGNMRFKARERYSFGFQTHALFSVHRAHKRTIIRKGRLSAAFSLLYNMYIPDSRMVRLTLATTGDNHGSIYFFRTSSFKRWFSRSPL